MPTILRSRILDEFEGKGVLGPVLVDDRRDARFHEGTHFCEERLFIVAKDLTDAIKIAVDVWKSVGGRWGGSH